ncbi:hypothetical protein QFW96_09920 [Saccharopolyspora sp. TS4A08]|uniref:Uncharacterized protein n=1 Tax=Saccharopolyspora ipomoeae TaxID=3042027 RepID=A0ABT6PLW5_9PSEU|nr:hypothetical protein [Saccharopolyspora sp. TS4A08]MDI2028929.1 hypothetical protein [Saccharopolyspora sp. TS4A08]
MDDHPSDLSDPGLGDTVTVAELIRRGPHAPEQGLLAGDLDERPDLTSASPPLGGLVALAVLGVLLLVSAAGAGALVMAKPAQLPRPTDSAAAISGALALRPDLVLQAAWPFHDNGGFNAATEGSSAVVAAEPDNAHLANPAAGSAETTIGLVEDFYRRAQDAPDRLGELIAPELGQAEELRRAWEAVSAVRVVGLRRESDASVSAQVEAVYPDGRRVLLDQHLHVSPGPLPRIVGAELRSAHQLPPG